MVNEEKHLREAQLDEGEFDPVPQREMTDAQYEDYIAKIRDEVGYNDEAFESDPGSGFSSDCVLPPPPPHPVSIYITHTQSGSAAQLWLFVSVRACFLAFAHCLLCIDFENRYQMMTISSPGGHAEIMRFDVDSEDDAAEEDLIQVCISPGKHTSTHAHGRADENLALGCRRASIQVLALPAPQATLPLRLKHRTLNTKSPAITTPVYTLGATPAICVNQPDSS